SSDLNACIKILASVFVVSLKLHIEGHRQHFIAAKSFIDRSQVSYALQKQTSARQQHERQRHLSHHQDAVRRRSSSTTTHVGCVFKNRNEIKSSCFQRRRQSEPQNG